MNKQTELELADRAIKDAEIRLNTIKANLSAIEKEIDTLSTLEAQLEENLEYLKRNKVIALASEYKKAKEELKKVRVLLVRYRNDRETHRKAHTTAEEYVDFCKKAHDKLKQGNDNVLHGKFRKKRDNG